MILLLISNPDEVASLAPDIEPVDQSIEADAAVSEVPVNDVACEEEANAPITLAQK